MPREYFGEGLAADVGSAVRAALDQFVALGAVLVDISLPKTALSIPTYYIIAPAEASSNLARYDGMRFGHRAAEAKSLTDLYETTRAEGKPEKALPKIVEGRMNAFYKENCLVDQAYAKDPKTTVGKVVAATGGKINGFARFRVGA